MFFFDLKLFLMCVLGDIIQLVFVLCRVVDEVLDVDGCFFFFNVGVVIIYIDFGIVIYVCS